jgi:hypothetical protein
VQPAASIYGALPDVEGSKICLKAHGGMSPELVGVLCHGFA